MSTNSTDSDFDYIQSFHKVPPETLPGWFLQERCRIVTREKEPKFRLNKDGNCVLYWMQRDMRTVDNFALLLAQDLAVQMKVPLHVMHILWAPGGGSTDSNPNIPTLQDIPMTQRFGKFYLDGMKMVHTELEKCNTPLHMVHPKVVQGGKQKPPCHHFNVAHSIQKQVLEHHKLTPSIMICDMSPLRFIRQWHESPELQIILGETPFVQVDAHNVVPIWHASPKREYGARTIRSKLNKLVDDCLQYSQYKNGEIPQFTGNDRKMTPLPKFEYDFHQTYMEWDDSVKAVDYWEAGTDGALQQFEYFIKQGLNKFADLRNDPNHGREICSQLSPYFNLGHLAFARCMRELKQHNRDANGKASFIEEGFVRKELSDNFLWYSPHDYDSLDTTADWAKETLEQHRSDPREHLYTKQQLEDAMTHEDLWNAAQIQLKQEGKLHGFMRMYWAKKILEWTESPQQALEIAQYFNDYYALDGKCPNGFVGVGWSIMGIHDQGWKEREVFGKIRYMNYNGCKRKFKVADFVNKYPPAAENAAKVHTKGGGSAGGGYKRKASDGSGSGKSKKRKK
jgi:deoxyribodipyrimidine photo-lyase